MTITGIINDKVAGKTMLCVSSWGGKRDNNEAVKEKEILVLCCDFNWFIIFPIQSKPVYICGTK